MKKPLFALLATAAIAWPGMAAPPPFDTVAPIAFMEDMSSGAVLYQKNPDMRFPPASLAKMMTVYVAFDLIAHGKLDPNTKFTVQPETWKKWHGPEAGSTMFLSPGEQVSVENLLYGIITLSGNDACVVLAEGISGTEPAFVQRMNQERDRLGLRNSNFGTSNGWPDNGVTYVSARDLAHLAEATIRDYPQLYKKYYSRPDFTWGKTMGGQDITQGNRDPLLGRVPGADGLKTGHSEEAGYGFTGSAEQNGRRLVMVLAGIHDPHGTQTRISESVKFMNWGLHAWQSKKIVSKGRQVGTADVQLGTSNHVALVAPNDLTVTVPGGAVLPDMNAKIVYNGPIKAPIKAGDHVADLVITTPDMPQETLPLAAASDVGKAGFFGRAWAGLMSLFGA